MQTTTLKALDPRPVLRAAPQGKRNGSSLSPYGGLNHTLFGNRSVDTLQYYVSWSYACINRLAWGGASRQLVAYQEGVQDGQLDSQELKYDHWLSRLLRYPNKQLSTTAVWLLGYKWLLLNGNCYFWVEKDAKGMPEALWPLPANRVQILLGAVGQSPIAGYRFLRTDGRQFDIPAEEILHVAEPEPSEISPFIGASRMLAAMDAVQVDRETMAYLSRYFHNDALPAFVVQHPERMDDPQFETWKNRFNETFQGSGNAGKWAFLEDNMQITPIASNGRQQELQQMDLINRDRICIVFGVPEPYLTGKHQNKATSETVRTEFYNLGVHPLVELFTQALTRYARRIDETLVIDFNRYQYQDPVDERAEKELNVRLGIKTAEEYRLEEGLEPLPPAAISNELRTTVGGVTAMQTLLIAYGAGQVERSAAIATAVIVYGLTSEEAGRIFSERATPKPVAETESQPSEANSLTANAEGTTEAAQKVLRAKAIGEDATTEKALYAYWKRYDGITEGGAVALESAIAKAYKKLEREVLANIVDTKSLTRDVITAEPLFDEKLFTELLTDLTEEPLRQLLARVGEEVFDEARINYADHESSYTQRLAEVTTESTGKITTSVGTVKLDLQKLLREHWGRPATELKSLIQERFSHYTDAGAKRIARTTATFATGAAQKTASTTLVEEVDTIESVQRLWLPQVGGNRRPEHQLAAGQAENEQGLFFVGGEWLRWPGDGSAKNSIQCDCVTRLRIKRKKEEG